MRRLLDGSGHDRVENPQVALRKPFGVGRVADVVHCQNDWSGRPDRCRVSHVQHVEPLGQRPCREIDDEAKVRARGNQPLKADWRALPLPGAVNVKHNRIEFRFQFREAFHETLDVALVAGLLPADHVGIDADPYPFHGPSVSR